MAVAMNTRLMQTVDLCTLQEMMALTQRLRLLVRDDGTILAARADSKTVQRLYGVTVAQLASKNIEMLVDVFESTGSRSQTPTLLAGTRGCSWGAVHTASRQGMHMHCASHMCLLLQAARTRGTPRHQLHPQASLSSCGALRCTLLAPLGRAMDLHLSVLPGAALPRRRLVTRWDAAGHFACWGWPVCAAASSQAVEETGLFLGWSLLVSRPDHAATSLLLPAPEPSVACACFSLYLTEAEQRTMIAAFKGTHLCIWASTSLSCPRRRLRKQWWQQLTWRLWSQAQQRWSPMS